MLTRLPWCVNSNLLFPRVLAGADAHCSVRVTASACVWWLSTVSRGVCGHGVCHACSGNPPPVAPPIPTLFPPCSGLAHQESLHDVSQEDADTVPLAAAGGLGCFVDLPVDPDCEVGVVREDTDSGGGAPASGTASTVSPTGASCRWDDGGAQDEEDGEFFKVASARIGLSMCVCGGGGDMQRLCQCVLHGEGSLPSSVAL